MYSNCSHEATFRSTPVSLALLIFLMVFSFAHSARAQVNAAPLNQTLAQGQGAGNNYFLIASTPQDNNSDGDHMHLVATFNCNAYSNCNSTLDATFGNRGGFLTTYSARGANPTGLDVHLVAYRQPDNSTNIYIYLGNYYVSATYSVLDNAGDTIYSNPTANAATPTGTLVFDSSSPQYPPAFYSSFAGQLSAAGIVFPDSSVQTTAYVPGTITNTNGVVTIQNTAGTAGIQIASNTQAVGGLFGAGGNVVLQANSVFDTAFTGGSIYLAGTLRGDAKRSQAYFYGESAIGGNTLTGILIDGQDRGSGIQNNVGIGLAVGGVPAARLEVNGNIKLTAPTQNVIYGDGTVQNTAWNGVVPSQDYAESINVEGPRASYEPGDLIVIDPSTPGRFSRSETAYSRLIAGVFSTKPGVLGMKSLADLPNRQSEVPMAMMGIVPIKVNDENGSINPGDLLVTSSTPGYAMRGTDAARLVGAVVGKALAPLSTGSGVISALISLQ